MRKQPLSLKRSAFVRLLVITFSAVLLFYAIGMYLNFMGIDNVKSDLQEAMDTEARYIAGEIEREVENLTVFQQELASDDHLLRYTIAHGILSDYQRVEYIKSISNQLLRIKRFSSLVETASVHLPGLCRTIAADQTVYDSLDLQAWEQFSGYKGKIPIHTLEWENRIYLLYHRNERKEPLFVIEVGLSSDKLISRLAEMSSDEETAILLLREDDTPYAGTQGAVELNSQIARVGRDYHYNGSEYLITEAQLPSLNMKLRCFIPMNRVMEPMLQHNQWVWVLTLLAGILLTVYLLYYRLYILQPLNTIFESMRRAEKTGRFLIDHGNAEFDDIYAQFTGMVEKIESLAGRVYEEQFRAQRAELRQLQMQINPHFFYNTLFMVYRMAQAEGNEEIAQVCLNLSNYYRYITKMPEHDVKLGHEISHIHHYLEIQKIRFSARLTVEMDELPPELENEEIPPLMLQPIVENAFVHGMKDKTSGGYVAIRYEYGDTWYRVIVSDNSGHMNDEAVCELDRRLRCGEMAESSALQNLRRRMELRYGKEYELKLESHQNGLRVSVTFPRKER